jgi:ABC-type sugar transport system ATPase subunit
VESAAGRCRFVLSASIKVPIPDRYRALIEPYAGRPITLGVRSEHLRLTSVPGAENSVPGTQYSVAIPATVEAVEQLGAESHVYLKAGDHALSARAESNTRPAVGEPLFAAVLPEHLHFFDPLSEAAIRTPACG